MLTTGLGQPQESIPRGAQEIEARGQTLQSNVANPIAGGAPTDCPVCGDVEAEPIAVCSDFYNPPTAGRFTSVQSECRPTIHAPGNPASAPN